MAFQVKSLMWATLGMSAAMLLSGCGAKATTHAETQNPHEGRNPLEIRPAPALVKELKLGEPRWEEIAGSLRVAGRVEANERRLARVGSPVTGRITELLAFEGQKVHQGQVLAKLYSTQLSDAQFAFLRDQSQHELAARAADRAKQLLQANVIGTAEVQRRQAELDQASAELSSARVQLQVLGMSDAAITDLQTGRKLNSEFQVLATIAGTLLERKVTVGQIVQPAETAFTIADLSRVWLVAEVPEQSAGHLLTGKAVQAEIPAFPGQIIAGRLSFVSSIVNPETRTVTARMEVSNPQGLLKPAMLATILLKDRLERRHVIPATAVVREDNQDNVFVNREAGVFALRKVTLGEEFEDSRVLVDGVSPGEQIVLDGAFHLNNERKQKLLEGGA